MTCLKRVGTVLGLVVITLTGAGSPAALAQDIGLSVTPYLWVPFSSTKTTINGHTVNGTASTGDRIEWSTSVIGAGGQIELRYGDWAAFVDGFWGRITDTATLRGAFPVKTKLEGALIDFGVSYRFALTEAKKPAGENAIWLEPYIGGRYIPLSYSIKGETSGVIDVKRTFSGADPIFGGRLIMTLGEDWRFMLGGDIGGFGVYSNFTWSAIGMASYRFGIGDIFATALLGYKAVGLDIDSTRGGIAINLKQVLHGPVIGMTFKF